MHFRDAYYIYGHSNRAMLLTYFRVPPLALVVGLVSGGFFVLGIGLAFQKINVDLSVASGHYLLLPPSAILDWFASMGVFLNPFMFSTYLSRWV